MNELPTSDTSLTTDGAARRATNNQPTHRQGTSNSEFRRYFVARMLPITRAAIALGIVLVITLCALDAIYMPEVFHARSIPLRTVAMLVPMTLALAVTVLWREQPWLPYFVAAVALVSGMSSFYIAGLAGAEGTPYAQWGAIYVTFYIYLVLGLSARQSMLAGWPIFIVFIVHGGVSGMPATSLAYGGLFLGFSNVVGSYVSLMIERNAREIFESQKSLNELARTDSLTGLANRRTFDEHLDIIWLQAQRYERRIAVLLVDIDHFKLYNDCYGHQAGDACIQTVATKLGQRVSRPLDLVARYGGEEFAIVLYDASAVFLQTVADKICDDIRELMLEHKASPVNHIVTVSVGVASSRPIRERDADGLVRQADDALYEAKKRGRNQAVFFNKGWAGETTSFLASDIAPTKKKKVAASGG